MEVEAAVSDVFSAVVAMLDGQKRPQEPRNLGTSGRSIRNCRARSDCNMR